MEQRRRERRRSSHKLYFVKAKTQIQKKSEIMKRGKIDILLITGGDFENKFLATNIDKLLKILLSITENIYLVTFCDKKLISNLNMTRIYSLRNTGNRFKRFIFGQILVLKALLSIYKQNNIETTIFAFGQDLQILPIALSKIVSKRVIIRSDGRPTVVLRKYLKSGSLLKIYFFKLLEEVNYRLADALLTECEYMISENNFLKYNSRVGNLFVDIERFVNKKPTKLRRYDVGFIGRLSKEKGILNFLKSLKLLGGNFRAILIGDGEEKDNVLEEVHSLKLTYINWVENRELPDYLNEIKLLVVPSYKEGLPNIMLEAMACGTPVLATPVGAIPDVITDGETGFIMENNSPECIARNVIRALNHPNLERIAENARALVEREFTFEKAVERYEEILSKL